MSFRPTIRRTALRSAIATAALAGAVLVPAATAFADTTPTTPAPSSPAPTGPATATSAPTKPADEGTLIRTDKLTGGLSAKVYRHGEGPVTPTRCVAEIKENVGGGTAAFLGIGPSGPYVRFQDAAGGPFLDYSLNRLHPKLPESAGFDAEILNPNSSAPRLRFNLEGGGHRAGYADFPKLPKGCSFQYDTGSGTGHGSDTQSSQTSVVPKGSVAAGAEPAQSADPVLIEVGGAAALGAAGLGFVVLRRRTATAGR
ncbi:hypothetical protein [Streptomyces sp. RKAG290]|uniref:hypothetical protein n=1 Tax=Streptomyces sp. RKAG290 TaxID=2888348 RepID=UPI002033AB97|nr:hypothetical protein [Streptomyces sp. RKAG290]MCM2412191.1 hypothetical protein [Streptomyces sp. RKAG290]